MEVVSRAATVPALRGRWSLAGMLSTGASMLVLSGMVHLGFIVTDHIRENAIQRAASATALYMDSFVERYAQELATKSILSEEKRQALERLLSPAALHRPIVAFRIWKGDTVVFSNERELIGKTFARTSARDRAWQGQVAVEFDQPDGDDDEQVRSLNLPVLEVYAPVRERGTGHIIALVETYEIGVELRTQMWVKQLAAWATIFAIALAGVLLQFSFLKKITELSRLRSESEQRSRRISRANMHMSEMKERALRRVSNELCEGSAQCLELALLKFGSLDGLVSKAGAEIPLLADGYMQDLRIIRKALDDALFHTRQVAGKLLPVDIEDLSVAETLARAARSHQRRTGTPVEIETGELPQQLPYSVKAYLYHFALESLGCTCKRSSAQPQLLSVSCSDEKIVLKIVGAWMGAGSELPLIASSPTLRNLRDLIEALGGCFRLTLAPAGSVSLIAELSLADVEAADG
jgi:signal transduction histidine kinase